MDQEDPHRRTRLPIPTFWRGPIGFGVVGFRETTRVPRPRISPRSQHASLQWVVVSQPVHGGGSPRAWPVFSTGKSQLWLSG